jgi:hypothetical protein
MADEMTYGGLNLGRCAKFPRLDSTRTSEGAITDWEPALDIALDYIDPM